MFKLFFCLKLAVKVNYQITGQYHCYRVCPKVIKTRYSIIINTASAVAFPQVMPYSDVVRTAYDNINKMLYTLLIFIDYKKGI